jgi:hypothetical protein
MSLMPPRPLACRRICVVGAMIAAVVLAGDALAAQSPFGVATPDSSGSVFGGPLAPLFAWVALRRPNSTGCSPAPSPT